MQVAQLELLVRTLAGDETTMVLPSTATVLQVKWAISAKWEVVPAWQHLIHGSQLLEDTLLLDSVAAGQGNTPLQLTLVVDFERVWLDVRTMVSSAKAELLESLGTTGSKLGTSFTRQVALKLLGDNSRAVQTQAAQALMRVSANGDEAITDALVDCFMSHSKAAGGSLSRSQMEEQRLWLEAIRTCGMPRSSASAFARHIGHQNRERRQVAIMSMAQVTSEGESVAIAALGEQLLREQDASVQLELIKAIGAISGPENPFAINLLFQFQKLHRGAWEVHAEASKILHTITAEGDEARSAPVPTPPPEGWSNFFDIYAADRDWPWQGALAPCTVVQQN
mmetsp:Transcript_23449/g.54646  ORF Transcript_23449/g.54646 Transcript_23449/m.54646 type:complete len:338 (+) Transcript_23449:84-1097(+)